MYKRQGVVAVNKASLEIPKGIYGLLGENGAGKTTLMRVLTTVLKPVSYTHLFQYCQSSFNRHLAFVENFCQCFNCKVNEHMTIDTVSYTHLDVYKRQDQNQ